MQGKENLNSCYGMAVTSILRDQFTFSNENQIWARGPLKNLTLLQ